MDVLVAGNLSSISDEFMNLLQKNNKVVVFSDNFKQNLNNKNVVVYKDEGNNVELTQVFHSFDFSTTIYFSYALDGRIRMFDELEKLESMIYQSRKNNIQNFVYVTSNDIYDSKLFSQKETSRSVLLNACDQLCKTSAEKYGIHVTIIKIPYLYAIRNTECQLARWIRSAIEKKEICFRGNELVETDFLCDEDLGELLARIVSEPQSTYFEEVYIPGGNKCCLKAVADRLQEFDSEINMHYQNKKSCIPINVESDYARKEYGWFTQHILMDDLQDMYYIEMEKFSQKSRVHRMHNRNNKLKDIIRIAIEIILLFIAAEWGNHSVRNNVLLNFLDFRIIFVLVIGLLNGMRAGVISGLLAAGSYIRDGVLTTNLQILFFNVQNWIPFATYILFGAVTGYIKDKNDDAINNCKEESKILEAKYDFLMNLYQQVVSNKEKFNNQIIGYKDSLGKMYSVVKKLDSVIPDRIFLEAVSVLEEVLENDSIAIYSLEKSQGYARLSVRSRKLNSVLNKSINLNDYPAMLDELLQNHEFINKECIPGYPSYAYPIVRDGELAGVIMVIDAEERQMNIDFLNRFIILSNLIRDSLLKAMDAEELSECCITNTQILKKEEFSKLLEVRKSIQEKNYAEDMLIRIIPRSKSLHQISNAIMGLVRANDVMGIGKDDQIYLMLNQADDKGMQIISERLQSHQIEFQIV